MAINAGQVKELRERTGAGMMECKKALVQTDGDIDAAIELMRKQGLAKADKKAGRVAADGQVVIRAEGSRAVIAEVNCETDFVANGEDFTGFAEAVAAAILASPPADAEALAALPLAAGETVDERRRALVAKLGENIDVRRFQVIERQGDQFGIYRHGVRIGVLVDVSGGDEGLARDLAMHIAASRPACVQRAEVPAALLEREKDIIAAQARESGKPDNIIEKMVEGRLRKFVDEIALLGQPFVKAPEVTVEKLLHQDKATVNSFVRFEVGEGIEKKADNFAAEVMAQVRGG
ncbi:MAG TPA: translation elongation factor Ts [Gammaproteobacteria bacterium]|nr:translation elongation factor Ts [Gammaproteobacteria bacterium]